GRARFLSHLIRISLSPGGRARRGRDIMIRKSAWLLSAGFTVAATPAFAQVPPPPTPDTTQSNATPTEGSTAANAAVDDRAAERQPVDTAHIANTPALHNHALTHVFW